MGHASSLILEEVDLCFGIATQCKTGRHVKRNSTSTFCLLTSVTDIKLRNSGSNYN